MTPLDSVRRRPLLSFFALAILFSWIVWTPLAARGMGWPSPSASPYLHLVGGLGPLVAATIVTATCDGRAGLARLVSSCVSVRGRLFWVVFAIAAPILLFALAATVQGIAGQGQVHWSELGRSVEYPSLSRGTYCVANIVFYGFGEEVGWRGFALPRLQARASAWRSALLLGLAWAAWHLPLFAFAAGLSTMGVAATVGWLGSMVTGSILMTWLFNASRGSILSAALFHGVLDIVMSSPTHGTVQLIMGATITICGLLVPLILGTANLSRSKRVVKVGASGTRPQALPTS